MKSQYANLVGLSLVSFLASNSAFAQQSNQDIETITVAGIATPLERPKVAGSASIIDQAQIAASGAVNIGDLLRTVAGVNIGQTGPTGSLSEVRFRGSESNHIMVLIDGVAINDIGQGSLVDFSHISLANVQRIEILRGPQSALWGSNAIGGVINIITNADTSVSNTEFTSAALSVAAGNKGTYQASANAATKIDKLSMNVNASTYKTQGENISRDGTENDTYANTVISGGLDYRLDNYNRINLQSRLVNYTADADAYNFMTGFVSDANDVAKGTQSSFGLNWHFALGDTSQTPKYSHLLSIQLSEQNTDNFADNVFNRASGGKKLRVLWNNRINFSLNSFINLGLESTEEKFTQQGATTDAQSNQNQSNRSNSFVGSGVYGATQDLFFNYSYRHDNNSDFDDANSYRIGAAYSLAPNAKLFISTGRAIKNPTFVERFGFFPGSFLGNPNLKPEQQDSIEAGIEFDVENYRYQLSFYRAKLEDEVLGFVFDPESGQFTAQNASTDSKRQGLELSMQGQISQFTWQAQYSYLDASENNSAELRRARHTGSLLGTIELNSKHQLYLQADYSGSKLDRFFPPFPNPSEIVELRSYWLVSANYRYEITTQFKANIRFSNLFDHNYEDVFGYNTDGIRALAQLHYTWE